MIAAATLNEPVGWIETMESTRKWRCSHVSVIGSQYASGSRLSASMENELAPWMLPLTANRKKKTVWVVLRTASTPNPVIEALRVKVATGRKTTAASR